jgi:hypothetical protein
LTERKKKMKHVIEGTVEADDISVEDGGCARIATIGPDDGKESGIFVRIQSWDDDFDNRVTTSPAHPDFEKLFGGVATTGPGRPKSTLTGKKRVRITIETLD